MWRFMRVWQDDFFFFHLRVIIATGGQPFCLYQQMRTHSTNSEKRANDTCNEGASGVLGVGGAGAGIFFG